MYARAQYTDRTASNLEPYYNFQIDAQCGYYIRDA